MIDKNKQPPENDLKNNLRYLKLPFISDHYAAMATDAAQKAWSHVDYLTRLAEGEAAQREDRSIKRRIKQARFPAIKTLDQFQWSWPKSINRLQVQNLFRLKFVEDKANVIFIGGVGLGNYRKFLFMESNVINLLKNHNSCLFFFS